MSDNKKYYYMRLKENFFESPEITIMEAMPDGYLYSNILLKLYLKSLKDNGRLMLNAHIPYSPSMIATVTRHQIGTVEKALSVFQQLGLIEVIDNGAIYMLDIQNYIGASSTEGDRKRVYRNTIACERGGQMSDKRPPEIEIEKEIDIKKEIDNIICPEPEPDAPAQPEKAAEKSGLLIPLNDNTVYDVPLDKIKMWEHTYPAVDVRQEILKMIAWCYSNPAKKKTKRGVDRFINSWLDREQNKGGSSTRKGEMTGGTGQKGNSYDRWNDIRGCLTVTEDNTDGNQDLPFQ